MHMTSAIRGLVIVLTGLCATVQAGTIHVSTSGNDSLDGLSWQTAKQTVQAGLDAAQPDDQVWVAAGTYVQCITLKAGVALYGGFAGIETDLSQRNWTVNQTILDGNQAGSVVTAPSGATISTRIDGFTIRNGSGTISYSDSYGGGIYCESSSPTIANNTITGNTAGSGGGIYCESSSPTIANNTITGNTADSGGGISCGFSSSPIITNNTIAGNTADSGGGGISCGSFSSPMITNNTIAGNTADHYGGGIDCSSSSLTITNNTITGNTAGSGGGIYCSSSSPTITNNTITGNTAGSGGGIYCDYSSPEITNNTITGNTAYYYDYGGGISCYSYSSPTITNTIIAFNSSGIYCSGSTPTLRCCCVHGNTAYNYSGLTDPTGFNGNISADPQLADLGARNVHLQPTSPCINVGDDTPVQAGTDIDGQVRIQGAHVDIGADESDGTLWPAAPAILYVSPSGNDSNDGLSWASAKRTVQAGIDAGGTGSQVWVAAGTYVGTIRLGVGMALYGRFAGTETDLSQRNWGTNQTILDGNQAGSVVTAPPGATPSTRIDGFTIRNGKASAGGGIYSVYSSPTITNNTITGNTASDSGGGISCGYSSSPTITNNTIAGNTAHYYGGGIYCDSSSPTIANNTITGNTASYNGGGIYCYSSSPMITNNVITGNTASGGGGISCWTATPTITHNTITGNTASWGGGIYCSSSSSPTITYTIIAFNSSGIYRYGGTPTLRYCCVYGNTEYNYSGLADPTGTNGNISVDPGFVQATAPYDLHLLPGSPCINAGDPAYVPPAGATDMDGQPRRIGAAVDIGADEFHRTGDINGDGYVNVGDLQALVAVWGQGPNVAGPEDINGDGYVNVGDLQHLVANWGQ